MAGPYLPATFRRIEEMAGISIVCGIATTPAK